MPTQSTSAPPNPTYTLDAIPFPVAADTTIYENENTGINSSGYAVPMSDSAAIVFQGYALEEADNSGANGAINVPVNLICSGEDGRLYMFNTVSATQAWVGTLVYFTTDNSAGQSSVHSNVAGMVVQILSSSQIVVDTFRRSAA
jgi:hypothetical protein